jgi:cold shock CspA family protein
MIMQGTVSFYNTMQGFGLIKGSDDVEYYVHRLGVNAGTTLRGGMDVTFTPTGSDDQHQADEVQAV